MDQVTGRFVSEDRAKDGDNWCCYCNNSPTTMRDPDGHTSQLSDLSISLYALGLALAYMTLVEMETMNASGILAEQASCVAIMSMATAAVAVFAIALAGVEVSGPWSMAFAVTSAYVNTYYVKRMESMLVTAEDAAKVPILQQYVTVAFAYNLMLTGAVIAADMVE